MREQRAWQSICVSIDAFGAPGMARHTFYEILRKAGQALRAQRKQSAWHFIWVHRSEGWVNPRGGH